MWGRDAKQTPVLYVAAEGQSGLRQRMRALQDTMGEALDFHLIAQVVDLFDPNADLAHLIEAVKWFGAGVVVLDTLARTLIGGDESTPRDMGVYIANADRLREATGAHVIIVHHCGWDTSHARGSNSLIGAADLVMKVQGKRHEPHSVTVEYAKDDADGDTMGFALEVYDLGPDSKGKPRSTCIATEAEATTRADSESRLRAANDITLFREIRNAIDHGKGRMDRPEPEMPICATIRRKDLQAVLIANGWLQLPQKLPSETPQELPNGECVPDSEHKRLHKHLISLKVKGFIGFNRADAWLIAAPDSQNSPHSPETPPKTPQKLPNSPHSPRSIDRGVGSKGEWGSERGGEAIKNSKASYVTSGLTGTLVKSSYAGRT